MKVALIVAASFASLVQQAQGMVDAGAMHVEGRRLIETPRGLWIENHYIATVLGEENCVSVKQAIKEWKRKHENQGAFGLQGAEEMNSMQILESCFVPFSGGVELVQFVQGLEGIQQVEEDFAVQTTQDPASWGLNRIDQPELPLSQNVPFSASHTGKGVNVYVIDTGLNINHVDFALPGGKSRAVLGGDFIKESPVQDNHGHGTHCSGTATGSQYGIAKDSTVIGVKVLSKTGSGSTTGVIQGIEWAVNNQVNSFNGESAVLSMSLGGGKSSSMNDAVEKAARAGMIVVVAAGNSNTDACSASPASAGGNGRNGGVISVGSTTRTDYRSGFSNYGSCVDIFAPGSEITSAWVGSRTATNTISGTSMATPHVAGVAAILLEKHGMNKEFAQSELFALTVPGAVKNQGTKSPNLLLQVPTYTGPPTPATPKPTMPPTMGPPSLCVRSKNVCASRYELSTFGPIPGDNELVYGDLAKVNGDGLLCTGNSQDFSGKVVLVARGSCLFFDKVKNAERQGAKAVIIYLTQKYETVFPPAYYGEGNVDIPSLMINRADFVKFNRQLGKQIVLGSSSLDVSPTPPPVPTVQPTKNPTPMPTMRPTASCSSLRRKQCRGRSDCISSRVGRAWKCFENTGNKPGNVFTPEDCPKVGLDQAMEICSQNNMQLCSMDQLHFAATDSVCNYDNTFVWVSDGCSRNRRRKAFYKGKNREICRGSKSRFGVRCCESS